jgi:soluble lytic murein transglycosylase-like protein
MRSLINRSVVGCAVGPLALVLASSPAERPAPVPPPADWSPSVVAGAGVSPLSAADATLADSLIAESRLTAVEVRRPLERYFARFSNDRVLVRRVARAVIREARRQDVAVSLIAAVVITENTTLTPEAQSFVGAQGLMQVMPMHAGQLGCNSDDLVDVDSNICHGTTILARNLRRSGSASVALLRYNGCVKGTNTPNCHRYPVQVLTRAGRVRRELLAGVEMQPQVIQLAQR